VVVGSSKHRSHDLRWTNPECGWGPHPDRLAPVPGSADCCSEWGRVGLSFVSLSYRTALLAVAACALCGAAIGISVYSNATANQERFVQLWILPAPLAEGDYAGHLQVGLENHEGRTATFDVVVTTGPGRVLTSRHIELRPNGVWKKVLTRPKRQAISATVALSTEPTRVLNSVKLAKPARV
jgi:hypothetical protein